MLDGIGVMIGVFVGEVGAALHKNRADQHQDEQKGVKSPGLDGQHAADQYRNHRGAEGEGPDGLKPDLR